jgi:hypothetical protein
MARLIAYGCSFTYGDGLEDCWDIKQKISGDTPSKFAWPQVLADKLGLECVNLGKPGSSIKYATNKVLETEFQKDDIVVFLWPYFSRTCFFQDDGTERKLNPHTLNGWSRSIHEKRYAREYYEKFFTETDALKDGYLFINLANYHLTSLGIKSYHYSAQHTEINDLVRPDTPQWSDVKLLPRTFKFIDKGLDNIHPGSESHKLFAEGILEDITGDVSA